MSRTGISELKAEMPADWQYERRKEYLMGRMTDKLTEAMEWLNKYHEYKEAGKTLDMVLAGDKVMALTEEVQKMKDELFFSKRQKKDEITPDMIERAKSYPFEELHPFKRGMALCPFHQDKTPSMSLKNNRARCWSCDASWDTIDFLMKRDGMTFADAVRRLQ